MAATTITRTERCWRLPARTARRPPSWRSSGSSSRSSGPSCTPATTVDEIGPVGGAGARDRRRGCPDGGGVLDPGVRARGRAVAPTRASRTSATRSSCATGSRAPGHGSSPARWWRGRPARSPSRPGTCRWTPRCSWTQALAPVLHRCSFAQIERTVEAARAEFDPAAAEERRIAAAEERHFDVHLRQVSSTGLVAVAGMLDLADALVLRGDHRREGSHPGPGAPAGRAPVDGRRDARRRQRGAARGRDLHPRAGRTPRWSRWRTPAPP